MPEYNNSGLHDIEIIRLLEMSQKHLAESHDTPSHTSMQYYFTGGYFMYVTLLLRNIGFVILPDPSIINAVSQDQVNQILASNQKVNSPTTILACTFISSSVCSLTYWVSEELFSITLGKSNEFRSYQFINTLLCGAVVVSSMANLAEPHLCLLMGAIGGMVYSVMSRIYGRFKVLTGHHSIIFGFNTIICQICVGLFSRQSGILTTNT